MDPNNFQNFLQQFLAGGGVFPNQPPTDTDVDFQIKDEGVYIYEDDIEKKYNNQLSNIHKEPKENNIKLEQMILMDSQKSKKFISVLNEAFAGVSSKGGVCGKVLTSADSGWKCQDCELDPTCIICSECFEKGDHKGHRIFFKKSVSGMCDCGDPEAWRLEGNCSDHSGFTNEELVLPKEFKENFVRGFRRCMYYLFYYLERPCNNKTYNKYVADCILHIFESLRKLFNQYPKLSLLIAECMIMPANFALGTENENKFKMWHCCKNIQEFHDDYEVYQEKTNNPANMEDHPVCECNLLEMFFRNSCKFQKREKKISEIFQCFYANYEFKKLHSIYYMKYAYFLVRDSTISKLWSNSIQLLTSEDLAYDSITSPYFPNFQSSVDEQLTELVTNNKDTYWDTTHQIVYTVRYLFMKKRAVRFLLVESNLVYEFQSVFKIFNETRSYFHYEKDMNDITILEQKLVDNVNSEDRILDFIKELGVMINQLSETDRELAYTNFIQAVVKIILEDHDSEEGEDKNMNTYWKNDNKKEKISITCLYHRIFGSLCMNYVCLSKKNDVLTFVEPCKDKIQKQNDLLFSESNLYKGELLSQKKDQFWRIILKRATECIGFSREIERNQWSFMGPCADFLKRIYRKCCLFDSDFIQVQFSIFHLDTASCWTIIVNNFSNLQVYKILKDLTYDKSTKNNKYKHIKNLLENDESKYQHLLKLIGDHIEFISQICNNELSISFMQYESILAGQDNATQEFIPAGGGFYDNSIRNFLLNYMALMEPVSHKDFKKKGESMVSSNYEIDAILSEITVFDKKTKKLRLKPALKSKMAGKFETRLFWKKQRILNSMQDQDKSLLRNEGKLVYVSDSTIKMNKELREHQFNGASIEGLFRVILQKGQISQSDQFMTSFYGLIITLGEIEANRPYISKVILHVKETIFNDQLADPKFAFKETLLEINNCISTQLEDWPLDESNTQKNSLNNEFMIESSKGVNTKKVDNSDKEMLKRKKNKLMKKMAGKKNKWIEAAKEGTKTDKVDEKDDNYKIMCQQCQEEINFDDNYYYFGEQHYCNAREQTKLNIFSDLLYEQNKFGNEFDSMVAQRQNFKILAEKNCDIFIKSCGHCVHTKCLDQKSNMNFLGGMGNLYEKHHEFPCNLCKSAISLPIPYFARDDVIFKFEESLKKQQSTETKSSVQDGTENNQLIKLVQKLDNGVLNIENYVKSELDESDQIELQFIKESEKAQNEFIVRFIATNGKHKENSREVLSAKSKIGFKTNEFLINALKSIKSQILFTDIIGINSTYKLAKQYHLVFNCVRKHILIELYNIPDNGNKQMAEKFVEEKIGYAVKKFVDSVTNLCLDTFFNAENLQMNTEISKKNTFIYVDLDQTYAEMVSVLPLLKIGKKQMIETCNEFSNLFFGLKILQFYMRNQETDQEKLTNLDLDQIKNEKLIDTLITLLKKIVTFELVVKYPTIERRNDLIWVEKLENLLKINILDKSEELKLYMDFLDINLNMKSVFYTMKILLSLVNVKEFDHKTWFSQFNLNWNSNPIELLQTDNKMDEENLVTENDQNKMMEEDPNQGSDQLDNIVQENTDKIESIDQSEIIPETLIEEKQESEVKLKTKKNKKLLKQNEQEEEITAKLNEFMKNNEELEKIQDIVLEKVENPENEMIMEKSVNPSIDKLLIENDSPFKKIYNAMLIEKNTEQTWQDYAVCNDIVNIDYQLFKHDRQISFSLVDLDPVFFDFYQNNQYRKCEVCNDFPKKTDQVLCQLCNYICCLGECSKGVRESERGNAAKHAYECHGGACVYVNIMSGLALITEDGRYQYQGSIYQDKFGNGFADLNRSRFGEKEVDLHTLNVNYDCLSSLQKRLLEFGLRYDIINTSLSQNQMYRRFNL